VTTRPRRLGEVDGRDYVFVDRTEFEAMRQDGAFLESEELFGNWYGTLRGPIEKALAEGSVFVVDVDVKGAESILAAYPEAETVFIMPPDEQALRQRLAGRRTEDADELERRLDRARREMDVGRRYKHIVVNDSLDRAVAEVRRIVGVLKAGIERGAR
jgi:guanylate kinase